jgi:hypothetical protein
MEQSERPENRSAQQQMYEGHAAQQQGYESSAKNDIGGQHIADIQRRSRARKWQQAGKYIGITLGVLAVLGIGIILGANFPRLELVVRYAAEGIAWVVGIWLFTLVLYLFFYTINSARRRARGLPVRPFWSRWGD